MILSDRDIKRMLKTGHIKLDPKPDLETQLGSASLDLRLSTKFKVFKPSSTPYIDPRDSSTFDDLTESADVSQNKSAQPLLPHMPKGPRAFIIHPGAFVLGLTKEHVELPADIAARIDGRSSLGRLGIVIHSTAGHIDPGWAGQLTLEMTNIGTVPVLLYPDMRICQLVFETMSNPVEVSYQEKKGAKYARMSEPGTSKLTEDR